MPGNSHADFTNWQVLILARQHPGTRISELSEIAKKEMPSFYWSRHKIRNAAKRLSKAGRIAIDQSPSREARLWPVL